MNNQLCIATIFLGLPRCLIGGRGGRFDKLKAPSRSRGRPCGPALERTSDARASHPYQPTATRCLVAQSRGHVFPDESIRGLVHCLACIRTAMSQNRAQKTRFSSGMRRPMHSPRSRKFESQHSIFLTTNGHEETRSWIRCLTFVFIGVHSWLTWFAVRLRRSRSGSIRGSIDFKVIATFGVPTSENLLRWVDEFPEQNQGIVRARLAVWPSLCRGRATA
jgi:hypothetical protein